MVVIKNKVNFIFEFIDYTEVYLFIYLDNRLKILSENELFPID